MGGPRAIVSSLGALGVASGLACGGAPGAEASTFGPGLSPETDTGAVETSSTGGDPPDPSSDGADDSGDSGSAPPDVGSTTGEDPEGMPECPALEPWASSAPFATGDDTSHPLPSFAVGDWYYVHTITGGDRILFSATPGPDGSLGAWQVASDDHGGGPHGYAGLRVGDAAFHFRNGHIAEYPFDDAGHMLGDVILHEADADSAFGGERFVWDSAVWVAFDSGAQWVFHLGGFSFTPYDYRRAIRRSSVPLQPSFAEVGRDHPADRPGKAAAFVPPGNSRGWIFTGEAGGGRLWRAEVTETGELGQWQPLDDRPSGTGNERGDLFVAGRALFSVRGAAVHRAFVDDDGTLEAWTPMPSLPEDQIDITWGEGHLEGAAWGIIGDLVLLTGPKVVFTSRLVPDACPG